MAKSALENAKKLGDKLAAEINALQAALELKRKDLERVRAFIEDYLKFASGAPELEFVPPAPGFRSPAKAREKAREPGQGACR